MTSYGQWWEYRQEWLTKYGPKFVIEEQDVTLFSKTSLGEEDVISIEEIKKSLATTKLGQASRPKGAPVEVTNSTYVSVFR